MAVSRFYSFFGSFSSFFGAVLNITVMSALADIANEHDLNTGLRLEGIFYSARAFFSKAMNAVGHIVAGIAPQYYIFLPQSPYLERFQATLFSGLVSKIDPSQ